MDPAARDHFAAADRNLTIADDLLHHTPYGLSDSAFEWVVIVSFYSTVRVINALILHNTRSLPRTHGERFQYIIQSSALRPLKDDYRDLRDWSEQARYTVTPSAFDGYLAQTALDSAQGIRDHIHRYLANRPDR